jgi:alpha-tubulin suppressor-like RCC1 family protein
VNGQVACFGQNNDGQLGTGDTVSSAFPVTVDGLPPAKSLAAGERHTCAVLADGRLACWGDNTSLQITVDAELSSSLVPVFEEIPAQLAASLGRPTDVAAGSLHTCFSWSTGGVSCRGDDQYEQLGQTDNGLYSVEAAQAGSLVSMKDFTCALSSDGEAMCWGRNDEGQLGGASVQATENEAAAIPGLTDLVSVDVGHAHGCALTASGDVLCWGAGSQGQIGDGEATQSLPTPVVDPLGAVFKDIAAGEAHSCALSAGGEVTCWGSNAFGQLGLPNVLTANVPMAVPGI